MAHARSILARLAIEGVDPQAILLPVYESLADPAALGACIDRVVALPLGSTRNVGNARLMDPNGSTTCLHWLTIAALAGTAAYGFAALAASRVRSFLPSIPRRALSTWTHAAPHTRTGARGVKRAKLADGGPQLAHT
ncbi:MAG: hypothetical protein ACO32I_09580, partial [Candidatus Limnocylindrus sp.]